MTMKRLYLLPVALLILCSCENFYLENQLGYQTTITDVRNFSYSLTDADYSAIASNPANRNMAAGMGKSEGDSSVYFLLQNLASNKYFGADTVIVPELFIPAFLANLYPQLSAGTLCEVNYRTVAEKPLYMDDFHIIRDFNPPEPLASVDDIVSALEANVNPLLKREGYKFVVNFADDKTYLYQFADGAFSEYHSDQIDVVALTKKDYATIGSTTIAEPERVVPILLRQLYPFAAADTKFALIFKSSSGNTIREVSFDGSDWTLDSKLTEESMSFEMKDKWIANISTYLNEPFIGHGQGNFVIQNVFLESPLKYTWYYSATYGMCSSAFTSGASYKSDTWLISPKVKLKKAVRPQLIFDQAFNKADNFTEEAHVMVSTDYKGDATTATWTELPWNLNEDGTLNVPLGNSWVFQSSGNMDLSAWAGQTIYIGFHYTTGPNADGVNVSGTWELKNVLVFEPEAQ